MKNRKNPRNLIFFGERISKSHVLEQGNLLSAKICRLYLRQKHEHIQSDMYEMCLNFIDYALLVCVLRPKLNRKSFNFKITYEAPRQKLLTLLCFLWRNTSGAFFPFTLL